VKVAYRTKRWHALIDFRDYLTRTKAENVTQFNGHELVTDQGRYGLVFGELIFYPSVKNLVVKKAVVKKAPVKKKAVVKKPTVKKAVVKKKKL